MGAAVSLAAFTGAVASAGGEGVPFCASDTDTAAGLSSCSGAVVVASVADNLVADGALIFAAGDFAGMTSFPFGDAAGALATPPKVEAPLEVFDAPPSDMADFGGKALTGVDAAVDGVLP